jgi:acyl carrier protein
MNESRAINGETLKTELTEIIASVLDMDTADIPYEADLIEQLNVDSVMILEIVVTLERVYGRKLTQEDMGRIRSVKDVSELLLSPPRTTEAASV